MWVRACARTRTTHAQIQSLAGYKINFFTLAVVTSACYICQNNQASRSLHNKSTAQPFTD